MKNYLSDYSQTAISTIESLDLAVIEQVVKSFVELRQNGGRLFILGVGGSAANASHAVNDFRKIANIEAYAPTDNVSELTARTNDQGWSEVFIDWLKCSRLSHKDAVLIFSVGAGSISQNLSVNLIKALDYARDCDAMTVTVAGREQGYCMKNSQYAIHLSVAEPTLLTPVSEAMQALVWHAIVSHPMLKESQTTWEAIKNVK